MEKQDKQKISIDDALRHGSRDDAVIDGNSLRHASTYVRNLVIRLRPETKGPLVDIVIERLRETMAEVSNIIGKYNGVSNYPEETYNEITGHMEKYLDEKLYEKIVVNNGE